MYINIDPHKNLDFLIDNLEILNEEYSFNLDIFGNGSYFNKISNEIF